MLKSPSAWSQAAFGSSLQDLARAGQPPHVLLDCLRFLAARGLTAPSLFSSPVNKRQLLALKEAYDAGRRALRSAKVAANLDPSAAANLLLLWLGALPEPLFPAEHVPELLAAHASGALPRDQSVAIMRALLKRTEPFIVEALFPLFELLHHYWINQNDREACLAELVATFAAPVFGTPAEHGAGPEAAATLEAAAALLIVEYRPLFTQPYNLQRYAADLARQAAEAEAKAKASRSSAVVASSPVPTQAAGKASPHYYHPALDSILTDVAGSPKLEVGSPLLTPRRMGALSVMCPTTREELFGTSPDDGLGSPMLNSSYSSDGGAADDVEAMVEGLLESTVAAAFVGQLHTHHAASKGGAPGGVSVLDHCDVSRDTSDSDAEMPSYEAMATMLS